MRRVVVTGMGVVAPIGIGKDAFFEGLSEARSGIGPIRAFDASTFPTRIAGQVPLLDPNLVELDFEYGPAISRDPKSLYGLVAGREALNAAFGEDGPSAHYRPERIACIMATGLEIFHLQDAVTQVQDGVLDAGRLLPLVEAAAPHSFLQIPAHLTARRLAEEARAQGLFSVNVSACAAGTQALGEAFLAVRDGIADAVLTGGYDSMVNPLGVGGFCMLEALSKSNELGPAASRPFDARRDGFVLGEGAAGLVLEERKAALDRGATIQAEVLGYASTMDAYRVSDPAEDQRMSSQCMRLAIADAGLSPADIDYINAHGTGTRKNDPAEAEAIRRVLSASADTTPVSSTKSQIGHLIGAAGAVEFVACVFALEQDLLPATINLEQPDPACALDHVAQRPRPQRIDTFLSNSFGFGGQNATIAAGRDRG
jgi:3-oxoacyl-[acyl-carrier-protein] synthase II